jgi:hypothetical protein
MVDLVDVDVVVIVDSMVDRRFFPFPLFSKTTVAG